MRKFYWLGVISFLVLWLAGCASVSQTTSPSAPVKQTWGERVQTLSNIQNWHLTGLISIRNNTQPPQNISANLQWQQLRQNYQLLLFGPLGVSAVTLKGSPGHVTLQTSNGQLFQSNSPENLLAEQTTWRLPVSNLYYWIRGLPVPNNQAKKQLDASQHLTVLQQQGWQVQYLNYTTVNHVDVPNKIVLTNSDFTIKIIIKQWML